MNLADIPFYVINLKASPERLENATQEFDALGLSFERIDAIDGHSLSPEDLSRYDDKACQGYFGRSLRAGEIACYLSHLKALKTFVASGQPYGVIIEDDFRAVEEFKTNLQDLLQWLDKNNQQNTYDLISLCTRRHQLASKITDLTNTTLYKAHLFPMLGLGILWTQKGAQSFLDASQKLWLSFDAFTRYYYTRNQRGLYCYTPIILPSTKTKDSDLLARGKTPDSHPLKWLVRRKRLLTEKFIALSHKLRWRS